MAFFKKLKRKSQQPQQDSRKDARIAQEPHSEMFRSTEEHATPAEATAQSNLQLGLSSSIFSGLQVKKTEVESLTHMESSPGKEGMSSFDFLNISMVTPDQNVPQTAVVDDDEVVEESTAKSGASLHDLQKVEHEDSPAVSKDPAEALTATSLETDSSRVVVESLPPPLPSSDSGTESAFEFLSKRLSTNNNRLPEQGQEESTSLSEPQLAFPFLRSSPAPAPTPPSPTSSSSTPTITTIPEDQVMVEEGTSVTTTTTTPLSVSVAPHGLSLPMSLPSSSSPSPSPSAGKNMVDDPLSSPPSLSSSLLTTTTTTTTSSTAVPVASPSHQLTLLLAGAELKKKKQTEGTPLEPSSKHFQPGTDGQERRVQPAPASGRLQPLTERKKKKRKAVRPGVSTSTRDTGAGVGDDGHHHSTATAEEDSHTMPLPHQHHHHHQADDPDSVSIGSSHSSSIADIKTASIVQFDSTETTITKVLSDTGANSLGEPLEPHPLPTGDLQHTQQHSPEKEEEGVKEEEDKRVKHGITKNKKVEDKQEPQRSGPSLQDAPTKNKSSIAVKGEGGRLALSAEEAGGVNADVSQQKKEREQPADSLSDNNSAVHMGRGSKAERRSSEEDAEIIMRPSPPPLPLASSAGSSMELLDAHARESDGIEIDSELVEVFSTASGTSPPPLPLSPHPHPPPSLPGTTVQYEIELSSDDRLTAVMQSTDSNLEKIRTSLSALNQEKGKALEAQLEAVKQQMQRRSQVRELKAQEAKALNEEDYELAEKLSRQVGAIQLHQEWTIASTSRNILEEWVKQCCELLRSESEMRAVSIQHLTELKSGQANVLKEMESKFTSQQAKERKHLKALEDKVASKRGHVSLDKERLLNNENQLQEEVDERCAEFVSEKKQLEDKQKLLRSEIAAMEAKLVELREEEGKIGRSIQSAEEKIEAVRQEMATENTQLREERAEVERQEQEVLKEMASLDELKGEFERLAVQQETERNRVMEIIGATQVRLDESDSRTGLLRVSLEQAGDLLNNTAVSGVDLLQPSKQLHSLRERHAAKSGEEGAATACVLSLQSDLLALRKKIQSQEEQLPQLEEVKKTAVSGRQYKEASRIVSEMKAVNVSLEAERSNVREKEVELGRQRRVSEGFKQELESIEEELASTEKQDDTEHIRRLKSNVLLLKKKLSSLEEFPGSPVCLILSRWRGLHQLLGEVLMAKHSLSSSQFCEDVDEEGENMTCRDSSRKEEEEESSSEVRTPGVGREGEGDGSTKRSREEGKREGKREGEEEGEEDEGGASLAKKKEIVRLRELKAELEGLISDACQREDYDQAAELDAKLQEVVTVLQES